MKNYILNKDYFDNIDSERKAYFLGFIYADGCNCRYKDYKTKKHNLRYRFTIALKSTDIEILEELNKDLTNSTKPILYRKAQSRTYNDKPINSTPQYKIDICDKDFCESLFNAGVFFGKRKTGKMSIPNISIELLPHFIRGYLDGDGCIILRKDPSKLTLQSRIVFVGSKYFLRELQSKIMQILSINVCTIFKENNKWGQLYINGNLQVITFLDWIYNCSSVYLKRKYNIYSKIPRNCQKSNLEFRVGDLDLTAAEIARLFGISPSLMSHLKHTKKLQPHEILLYLSTKYKKIGDEHKEVDKRTVFI